MADPNALSRDHFLQLLRDAVETKQGLPKGRLSSAAPSSDVLSDVEDKLIELERFSIVMAAVEEDESDAWLDQLGKRLQESLTLYNEDSGQPGADVSSGNPLTKHLQQAAYEGKL